MYAWSEALATECHRGVAPPGKNGVGATRHLSGSINLRLVLACWNVIPPDLFLPTPFTPSRHSGIQHCIIVFYDTHEASSLQGSKHQQSDAKEAEFASLRTRAVDPGHLSACVELCS